MAQTVIYKPDPKGAFPIGTYDDISLVNTSFIYDLTDGGWDYFTLQVATSGDVTLGSIVHKIRFSNDGSNPIDFSPAITQSVAGHTGLLTITGIGFVHSTLTTAGTSGALKLYARAARKKVGF